MVHRIADNRVIASLVTEIAAEHAGAGSALPRVILEMPVLNPLNGKFSWYSSGYAYGVWRGVMASHGLEA